MADIKVYQIGQQTATLPFYEVQFGGKKYIFGSDTANVIVQKPRTWMTNLNWSAGVVAMYEDTPSDAGIRSAMGLGGNYETSRDSRFPLANLGDGFKTVEGWDGTTGWAEGFPKNPTTSTAGTGGGSTGGGSTTTGGGSTTTGGGSTTTTGGGSTSTGGGNVPVVAAPTTGDTITEYVKKYWWVGLLLLGAVLWKPVIAPALGLGSKTRRRMR